ncbi:hypothetical protein D6C83_04874 [Aureobasidium pullulans]|uniref:Uncharacterized protein n=1 Tax=Aureobasidium pullulans TaxID=5580 RepID=A0A4T0CV02_AURPU|nr:hypothetical protein D6C83_04874 [Aureobasidium pullulans]
MVAKNYSIYLSAEKGLRPGLGVLDAFFKHSPADSELTSLRAWRRTDVHRNVWTKLAPAQKQQSYGSDLEKVARCILSLHRMPQIDIATLEKNSNETIVFPQQAALAALEAAATTHRANTIAQYDPRASSPQAAQLAFDAVAEAKAHESCQLILIPQGVNGYGIEEHSYELRHPRAGAFIISVDGIFDFTKQSNARITLHQPTNPEKSLSKPSKLVCFDLGTGTLDIDVASFRRLHSRYMIDSAICAVLAVAFAESRLVEAKAKSETFAGPPLTTKKDVELSKRAKRSRWRRPLGKKKTK